MGTKEQSKEISDRELARNVYRLLLKKLQEKSEKKNISKIELCLLTYALAKLVSAKASYPALF